MLSPEQWTVAGLLVTAMLAGMRGIWVWGWLYQAALKEAEFWRDRALGGTGLAEIAADAAERRPR